jgi:NAD(P)-dependent dehydrogenase (short-subunit alcohol dehydrogenase family)
MIAKKYGKIVCVSSLAGKIGGTHSGPPYVASKGGINALVKWASKAGAASSVYVNAIAPGPVKTAMIEGVTYPDSSLPLQRLGEPEDIAEAALFLSSQASNWMTGIVLDVNGGRFIG